MGIYLLGGLVAINFISPRNIGNFIIPTDELIFFRGVALAHQPDNHQCMTLQQSQDASTHLSHCHPGCIPRNIIPNASRFARIFPKTCHKVHRYTTHGSTCVCESFNPRLPQLNHRNSNINLGWNAK